MGLDALLARLESPGVTLKPLSETRTLQNRTTPLRACTLVTPVTPPKRHYPEARQAGLSIVNFRLKVDAPGIWHTALGPDQLDLIADLRARYRERLDGLRPHPLSNPDSESDASRSGAEPTKFP